MKQARANLTRIVSRLTRRSLTSFRVRLNCANWICCLVFMVNPWMLGYPLDSQTKCFIAYPLIIILWCASDCFPDVCITLGLCEQIRNLHCHHRDNPCEWIRLYCYCRNIVGFLAATTKSLNWILAHVVMSCSLRILLFITEPACQADLTEPRMIWCMSRYA